MCKVSFVTSVYNCEEFITETIQSVIAQTFTDWEYIIIDDCSKDKSAEIIKSFSDDRIKLIVNEKNAGQSANLNKGISLAKGKYIARLDHDDICYPQRIEKQYMYMEENPDIDICGCWNDIWREGRIEKIEYPPIYGKSEQMFSLFCGNFTMAHSSFFIRKDSLIRNNITYSQYRYAEDFDLIFQFLKNGNIGFIEEALLAYRVFDDQFTQTCGNELIDNEIRDIYNKYQCDFDFRYNSYIARAVTERNIRKVKDYKALEEACINCARFFGIDKDEVIYNDCVRCVYESLFRRQGNKPVAVVAYFISRILSKKWLFSSDGIKFIIACLMCYNK